MVRVKTVEFPFDTLLTTIATNTTLATATRHDFSAITLYIPETSGRLFKSVIIDVGWRCASATFSTYLGWRIGVKLGAVAFDDRDYVPSSITGSTQDHEYSFIHRDVTNYFNANFGSSGTQTCQVGFAMQQNAARAVGPVTCKLIITYEYNDTNGTQVKTVRIPIQSHHTNLTTSHVEIGTTGGANNAPVNQIPALSTFLPESSKTIRSSWIESYANDGISGTADVNQVIRVDSLTEVNRGTLEAALVTGNFYRDIYLYDAVTVGLSTAHAFNSRSTVNTRFYCLGAILCVTYEYDSGASSTIINSLLLPLTSNANSACVSSPDTDSSDVYALDVFIEEPDNVQLKQSAVVYYAHSNNEATTLVVSAGSQAERSYTIVSLGSISGPYMIVHRVDHNSGWTLSRGRNKFSIKCYITASPQTLSLSGYVILNYISSKSTLGVDSHAKSTCWNICDYSTTDAAAEVRVIPASGTAIPSIPESKYQIMGSYVEGFPRYSDPNNYMSLSAKVLTGEWLGSGWRLLSNEYVRTQAELGTRPAIFNTTNFWNRSPSISGAANITSQRDYRYISAVPATICARQWITYHSNAFTVSGTVSGYSGNGSGIVVEVYSRESNQVVASGITSVGGFYNIQVMDSVYRHFAVARQDDTHLGRSDDGAPT